MEWALPTDISKSCAMCATLTLRFLRIMSSTRCTMSDLLTVVGLPCPSAPVKSVRPSSNCWTHFTIAEKAQCVWLFTEKEMDKRIQLNYKSKHGNIYPQVQEHPSIQTDRTPPHAPVPDAIMATEPVEWT
ncbi:hypothetical protein AVEN_158823-1 [Araneus ventricosus]|uniref:Uncharacterized protein n=1 Tax=Araneus ventricosus TaxID=182803 RepID=A0A4Y2QKY6_ARAVE|nr:hypothetical protein AVEN_158823-1 [Araneus ventricosus]